MLYPYNYLRKGCGSYYVAVGEDWDERQDASRRVKDVGLIYKIKLGTKQAC